MCTDLLAFYQNKIKKRWKLAFFWSFFFGLIVHMYRFTNLLPNHDSVYNFYNSQNMVASGRWFLSIACSLSSYADLPWIIGLVSLVYIGIAAAIIAEIFRMDNPVVIALSSALLVSFPAITATMTYEFTADGYMLAMVLAALSVWLSRMEMVEARNRRALFLSGLCICLSCGIYQAYVSFAFATAVCYLIVELLENRREGKLYWKWVANQVIIYPCAMAGYYLIWKLLMRLQGVQATAYQGIDSLLVGEGGVLHTFCSSLIDAIKNFLLFFSEWNPFVYGLTMYSTVNLLFFFVLCLTLLWASVKSGLWKRRGHLLLALVCLASLPVGCYIWLFASREVFYHTVMIQSISLVYILAAVVADRWVCNEGSRSRFLSKLVPLVLVAVVFVNSLCANMHYNFMQLCMTRTQATATELSTRIHLQDNGKVKYIVMYGELSNRAYENYVETPELRQIGGCKMQDRNILSPIFLSLYTDFQLSYYQINDLEYPLVELDEMTPAPLSWEFRFPLLPNEAQEELKQTQQVQDMPAWPAQGSVQRIGDTIVIKLSAFEVEQEESV